MAISPASKAGIEGRAGKLFNRLHREMEFSDTENAILVEAMKQLELCDRLAAELEAADLMIPGSRPGQMVVNGLVGELKSARLAAASMLKTIGLLNVDLDGDDKQAGAVLTRSEQARRAALVRHHGKGPRSVA